MNLREGQSTPPSQDPSVPSGRGAKAAFTVTALPGMVKVYLPPPWAVSLIPFPWLLVTVRASSPQPLSGEAVRVTVLPLLALVRSEVTLPCSDSSTVMA